MRLSDYSEKDGKRAAREATRRELARFLLTFGIGSVVITLGMMYATGLYTVL